MPFTRDDYIRQFRQDNPTLTNWSDEDILDKYTENFANDLAGHPALAERAQAKRLENTTFLNEAKGAIGAGIDQMQGKLYDTAALAGRVLGSETVEKFGREGSDRNLQEAAAYQPAVQSFEKVRTPKDFAYWLTNIVGTNAPQMAGTAAAAAGAAALAPEEIVGAGASGIAAGAVRLGRFLGFGAGEGAAAGLSTKALAALGGASAVGFTQMQNFGELEKQGGEDTVPLAIANGLIGAALEAYGPSQMLTQMGKVGIKKTAAEGVVRDLLTKFAPGPVVNVALTAAKHGSTEMLTEMTQEALTIATEFVANRNNPNFQLSDEAIKSRILNSGVAGFALGGLSGGVTHALGGEHAQTQTAQAPAEVSPQPASVATPAVSLDPSIPAVSPAELGRVAAPAPSPVAPPVVQTTPIAAPQVQLASPQSQQALVSLGMSSEQAATIPESEAQELISAAAKQAQAQQIAPQPQAAAAEQQRIEANARAQNAPLPVAPTLPPDATPQLSAAQERQLAPTTNVQSRVAQLRSQQAAARDFTNTEKIQLKTGGILGALKEQPSPEAVPISAQPGAKIFDLVNQAKQNAENLQGVMTPPKVEPVRASPISTVAPVSTNIETPPNSEIPSPAPQPIQTPQVAPQVTPQVAPQAETTHGLHGLDQLKLRQFLPVTEVSSIKAAATGDLRKPTDRFFVFERPDSQIEIRKVSATGNVAVRENMSATPETIAAAVSNAGKKISASMVRNILDGRSSPRAEEVKAEARRQGYTASGERIPVEKLTGEQGYKWLGTIVAEKGSALRHIQTLPRAEYDVAIAQAEENGRAAGTLKTGRAQAVKGTNISESVVAKLAANPEFDSLLALPADQRIGAWREAARAAGLTDNTTRSNVEAAFSAASARRVQKVESTPAAVVPEDRQNDRPISAVSPVETVVPDHVLLRPEPADSMDIVRRIGPKAVETLLALKGEKFAKAADNALEFIHANDSAKLDQLARLDPESRKNLRAALRGDLEVALDRHNQETLVDDRKIESEESTLLERRPASEDYLAPDADIEKRFNDGVRETAALGADVTLSKAKSEIKSGGQYDPSNREVSLTMKNVVSPTRQDFLNLIHETLHHVTENQPEWIRRALQDTFARLPIGEKGFYLNPEADPRLASNKNSSGLSRETYLMEQAVEHATLQGVDRQYAQGVIAAVWRTVKDYLLKGAIYLQKLLLGEEHTGGRLAKEWVENAAAQFLAGDRSVINGFLEQFGRVSTQGQIRRYVGERPISRFLSRDAKFTGEASTAAARYNVNAPIVAAQEALVHEGLVEKADAEADLRELVKDEVLLREIPDTKKEISAQVEAAIRQSISNAKIHAAVMNQLKRTYSGLFERAKKLETPMSREMILQLRREGKSVPDALTFENFITAHGIADPTLARDNGIAELNALLEQQSGTKPKGPVFDPEILIDQLSPTERGIAELELIKEVTRHNAKAARRLGAANDTIIRLRDQNETNRAKIQHITKFLGDYKETERVAVQSIVANLQELQKKVLPKSERLSEDVGMTRAILEQLEEDAGETFDAHFTQKVVDSLDVPELPLASIFKSLFALEQGRQFDLSEASVQEIRQHILDEVTRDPSSELSRLVAVGEGPNAKIRGTALLTAVISFAKKEAALTDTIRMQLTSATDRADRINELRSILNETSETKLAEIRQNVQKDLKRVGNRTIYNWLKQRDELLRDQRQLAAAERTRDLLRVSVPVLEDAQARASSRRGVMFNSVFAPGTAILNPASADWTSKQVFDSPHTLTVSRDKFMTSEQAREIMRNQAAWLDARKNDPLKDEAYLTMQMQHEQLLDAAVDKQLNLLSGLKNGAGHGIGEMMVRTSSPAGKLAARRWNGFEEIKRVESASDIALGKKYENAAEAFYRAAKVSPEWAHEAMYNQALDYLGSERSLDLKSAFLQLRAQFQENPNPQVERIAKDPIAWARFTDWMVAVEENNIRRTQISLKYGNRVLDEDIQRRDPGTRELKSALRNPVERGLEGFTVARGLNRQIKAVLASMNNRMAALGDGPASPFEAIDLRLKTDLAGVQQRLNEFFSDGDIRSVFLDPLIANQKATLPSPERTDGLKVALNPAIAREAWSESGGDLLKFAETVYKQLGTDGTPAGLEKYQASIVKFVKARIDALLRDVTKGEDSATTAPHGIPHVAMDARQGEDYPWQWLDFHQFSVEDNRAATHTIAANAKFGRNLEGIRADHAQILADLERLKNQMPGTEEQRQALKKKNPTRYALLEDAARQYNKYKDGALEQYLRNELEPTRGATGDMGLATEIYSTVLTGFLSGVKTALKDLSSLTHPFQLEKSVSLKTAETTLRSYAYAGKYGLAAVMNSILGTDLLRNDPLIRLQEAATGGDAARNLTYKELVTGTRGKGNVFDKTTFGKVQRGFRILRNVSANGRLGFNQGASGPALRVNFFPFATQLQIFSATSSYMRKTVELAQKTADFYRAHPDRIGQNVTAKDIGYSDAIGFTNLRAAMADFGVSIESLGEKILKTKSPDLANILDERIVQGITSMVQDKILLESGPNTRPTFMRGSKFARANSAFVGWSFAKTAALMDLVRDPERNMSVKTVLNGAAVMTLALMPAAIAGSLALDWYDEELTKKKSNLRSFTSNMSIGDAAKAVLERSVNMGSFGLPGEIVNSIVNSPDGAGQKTLSVDQRIVWLNSVIQLGQAISNFVAVGGVENANYANVYRQMFGALGGGGILQNIQLINGVLGTVDAPLFRDEAGVTARINVNNFLRSTGRDLQMDVLKGGAQAQPNAATPWVTNMVLAALSNDRDAFQEAYRGAVKAAEQVPGVTDPRKYVAQHFAARHPLKSVFKTVPNMQEVQQLLAAMPEEGRAATQQAINLMNAYGTPLGIPPYFGGTGGRTADLLHLQARSLGIPAGQASIDAIRAALAERRGGSEF